MIWQHISVHTYIRCTTWHRTYTHSLRYLWSHNKQTYIIYMQTYMHKHLITFHRIHTYNADRHRYTKSLHHISLRTYLHDVHTYGTSHHNPLHTNIQNTTSDLQTSIHYNHTYTHLYVHAIMHIYVHQHHITLQDIVFHTCIHTNTKHTHTYIHTLTLNFTPPTFQT